MNQYERAVLSAIEKGPDCVGWYKIEQRLSVMKLEVREYLPDTLRQLTTKGLIEEHPDKTGQFRITERGRSTLGCTG
jgi:hypothetical protein